MAYVADIITILYCYFFFHLFAGGQGGKGGERE